MDVYEQKILDKEQRSWVLCLLVLSEKEMKNFLKWLVNFVLIEVMTLDH